jgi:hypothetical protein
VPSTSDVDREDVLVESANVSWTKTIRMDTTAFILREHGLDNVLQQTPDVRNPANAWPTAMDDCFTNDPWCADPLSPSNASAGLYPCKIYVNCHLVNWQLYSILLNVNTVSKILPCSLG